MDAIQRIKGFADLFAPESDAFSFMEGIAREVFTAYGYRELRVPLMEHTELFARGIGAETDVVQKEMYTFSDRAGRSLTLRPEATAGVARAYIESARHNREQISKFFTYGPMFRYERPQKGRMRQFHQINCECIGAAEPLADAEVILMLMRFLSGIGLTGLSLELNSLGCRQCRPLYNKALAAHLSALDPGKLCEDCRRRMTTNPLRVLDCKVPGCRELTGDAPGIADYACSDCKTHFHVVLRILREADLPHVLNPRLVRGLDYYSRTTFEVVSSSIGAQGSVAGGGRYDRLMAQLGGPDLPAVGFACGMERLALMLGERPSPGPDFYLAVLDEAALESAMGIAQELREKNFRGELSFSARSLKSQLRQASRLNAKYCLLLGADELAAGAVTVKNMETGSQAAVKREALAGSL